MNLPEGLKPADWAFLVNEWVRCEPFIARAVERGEGAFDVHHVWSEIMARKAQFWPGVNGAIVTRIEDHPSGLRACLFWLAGGDDLTELKALEKAISAWAKAMGCTRVEIVGRRGWLRALEGYREGSTVLVKDI